MPTVSVIAPVFNEQESVREFHRRVSSALTGEDYELVLVDDGSSDDSPAILAELAAGDPRVRVLALSRNFGHQAAITAGLDNARATAVVTMDADLLDPPEFIPVLLDRWRQGADVVHAARKIRHDEPRWRLFMIRIFYWLFGRIAGLDNFPGNSGDFRLVSGPALGALKQLPERTRFLRGLVAWVGFRQETVYYDRDARYAGDSKYPLRKLMRLAADGIFTFSAVPLRLASIFGATFSVLALLAIPVVVLLRLTGIYSVPGTASIHILVLLVGGVQLVFLGVIGEYLARIYDEGKHRPIYVLRDGGGSSSAP
jgi:dolichol-phosphate mannosyltransferase